MSSKQPSNIGAGPFARTIILVLAAMFFAAPIIAMLEFTLRGGLEGGYTTSHWQDRFVGAADGDRAYRVLTEGLTNSLILVVVTVIIVIVLLLPTMFLVRLALPSLTKVLEFVCLVPITIPAIVLVVGLAPVYATIAQIFGSGAWTLAFAYGVTTLPFAYRAIDANMRLVDIRTLAEASRSLGAGWFATVCRVLLPNIRRGVLTAAVLSAAIVLGEYTIASLLNRTVLQTALVQIQQTDAFASVIVSLLALAFAFVLLLVIGSLDRGQRRSRKQ